MPNKAAPSSTPQLASTSPAHEAALDRLIELASDGKTLPKPPAESLTIAKAQKESEPGSPSGSVWKALTQLKSVLPYVSRLLPLVDARFLPLLEMLGIGHAQNGALARELSDHVAALQVSGKDLHLAVQEQSLEIKQLEEQIVQLREAQERNALEQADLLREIKSMGTLIRAVGAGLGILLVILILVVGGLIARGAR